MNRLLNIFVVLDQDDDFDREVERSIRLLGRVMTLGKATEGFEVDIPLVEQSDVRGFFKQLPEALRPDLLLMTKKGALLLHPTWTELPCAKMLIQKDGEKGQTDLSLWNLVVNFSTTEIDSLEVDKYLSLRLGVCDAIQVKQMAEAIKLCLGASSRQSQEYYQKFTDSPQKEAIVKQSDRSFVIAILDESPASPYNIGTLLQDLEKIEGEVIAVFNSLGMAKKYKDHSRVDRYVILSHNIGVGRAWNVGLMMSKSASVFFLNSDLKIGAKGVDELHAVLHQNKQVAVVGPCGGFTHFEILKDLYYISEKKHAGPTLVDQVSGFYFAVKRDLFSELNLAFYPEYLPCYMEEWDLALQLRSKELLALRVPIDDYAHEWGGTVQAHREVDCLGKKHLMSEVLRKNQQLFKARWSGRFPESQKVFIPQG